MLPAARTCAFLANRTRNCVLAQPLTMCADVPRMRASAVPQQRIARGEYWIPLFFPWHGRGIIKALLQVDPELRLGSKMVGMGANSRLGDQVRRHDFLRGVSFVALEQRQITPPYVPPVDKCACPSHPEIPPARALGIHARNRRVVKLAERWLTCRGLAPRQCH